MPALHEKIRAVRLLCGLTQPQVAELAHLHLRTYQRIERGTSAVTENMLEALAAAFNCTTDDIRNFDPETRQLAAAPDRLPETGRFEQENTALKAENDRLKHLLRKVFGEVPDFPEIRGGGGGNA
jgi:transcriptional regulator with XRE-family HTH domain